MPEADAPGGEPLLRFIDVHKQAADGRSVLTGLDLDIHRGEFLTLLGPSGGGKSTTLMMLAGFDTPTSGDILFKGQSIAEIPVYQRHFGVVFQNRALFPHLTALQNVTYPLHMRGVARAEATKRAKEMLAMVGLQSIGDEHPARLPAGEQQRVALARALVFDPEVVIMDEPLAALDVTLAHRMQREISRLHESLGNTVIYATQDQSEAIALADRIAILHDGRIQQSGTPEALYERPDTTFVAGFMGETNMLPGTVTSMSEKLCEVTLDSGEKVTATAANVSGAGARTTLAIRPERVLVDPPDGAPNRYACTVLASSFRGDYSLLRLRLGSGVELVAKTHPDLSPTPLAAGDEAHVGWLAHHCRALELHKDAD
ncbi:MAG: ABC transporter ATP-binding protein [Gammaproteobacteria bacterium]|nr:ABC transporter ATP-binding protein [Gammaproteobacteria bacterium]